MAFKYSPGNPCGGCCDESSSGSSSGSPACGHCIDGTKPTQLAVTFSGVVNGPICSDCSQFNASFILGNFAVALNKCLWYYRLPIPTCPPRNLGFTQITAEISASGANLGLKITLSALSQGDVTFATLLGPLFTVDCMVDKFLTYSFFSNTDNCNFASATCRVVGIP